MEQNLKMIFVNEFRQLPTLLILGNFEIKDTSSLNDQESSDNSLWEDYKDKLFDFLNVNFTSEYSFYDKENIIRIINEDYADEEDMDLNEEEIAIQYIDKVKYLLNEMYSRVERLWLIDTDYYDDEFNDRSIFVTAIKEEFFIDIEGIKELQEYVKKYYPDHMSPKEKVKKAEEIALTAHKGQNYGDHKGEDDYFIYHLDCVRNTALNIYKNEGIHQYKIEITALLHDVLEDTGFPAEEIEKLFGRRILNAVQALTYEKGTDYAEYFEKISDDRISKIVKAADRIVNISQLKDVNDVQQRQKLFLKYFYQYRYFEDYNIYPEAIADAFSSLILD